jgi:hypothetical protein
MKYFLLFFLITNLCLAQVTINYPHRNTHYTSVTDGGGFFNESTDQVGLWANGGNKQSLVFRAFDSNGDGTGDAITMDAGDSFTITLSAKRAYGEIGVALLNSPTATASWADKTNNSIAYCVLAGPNGPDSNNDWAPWKAHSNDGSTGTFTASGDPENYTDFVIEFTITSADEITITLGGESKILTVNSPTATHFSVWLNDDWSGSSNSNIYLKPTTQLVQNTLSIDKPNGSSRVLVSTTGDIYFGEKGHYELEVFNVQGKRVLNKSLDTQRRNQKLNFGLTKGLYLLKVKSEISTNSFVKKMLVK